MVAIETVVYEPAEADVSGMPKTSRLVFLIFYLAKPQTLFENASLAGSHEVLIDARRFATTIFVTVIFGIFPRPMDGSVDLSELLDGEFLDPLTTQSPIMPVRLVVWLVIYGQVPLPLI